MKLFKSFIHIVFTSVFIACGTPKNTANPSKGKKTPKADYSFKKHPNKLYFNILQLNDVYEIAPIQGGKFGGMARVETIRKELLKETANTITVLAGDFLNPSLIGTMKVEGERVRGRQMVEVMNAMNFEVVAFGNHEFDISYEQLQDRLNESNFDWISANVLHNRNGQAHYFHKVVNSRKEPLNDSFIKEFSYGKKSVKVGFISVCIPSNPRSYVTYGNIYEEIKRAYNDIKNQVDVVLGLTHLEISQDRKVAENLPKIPLIMGGHEHTNSFEKVGNVAIAKADANAKTVYIHRFEYDPLTKKLNTKSELRTVDETIPADEKVNAIVNKWQKILKSKIKEVIDNPDEIVYTAKIPLDARDTPIRSTQTNMGKIITKAMSFAFEDRVDCAFVNGGSVRIDDMLKGEISGVDIFRVLPYGGFVYKVKIKGNLLRKVLEYGKNAEGTGAYLQRYNCSKVNSEWQVKNEPIQNNRIYTVATTDFLLKGLDIPILKEGVSEVIEVYKPSKNELGYDIRKAVIEYLKKN